MTGGLGGVVTEIIQHSAKTQISNRPIFTVTVKENQWPHRISTIMAISLNLIHLVFVWSGDHANAVVMTIQTRSYGLVGKSLQTLQYAAPSHALL